MSIYSRPYMRPDDSSRSTSFDAVKWLLIVLGAAYLVQMVFKVWFAPTYKPLMQWVELAPTFFAGGRFHTLLTYGLLHGSLFHILFNALGLYFAGRALQARLGPTRLIELFIFSVLVGGVAWLAVSWTFHEGGGRLMGASAGVFGYLSLFALHTWRETVRFFFWFIPVSLTGQQIFYLLLGIQAFFFFFNEIAPGEMSMSGVAYSAHLGGFAVGYLYHRFFCERQPLWDTLGLGQRRRKPRSGGAKVTVGRYTVNLSKKPTREVRAEVDRILDKINQGGFGSLTDAEKKYLDDAKDILR